MKNLGRTIYLVKCGNDIIEKSFSLEKAKEALDLFNFAIEFGTENCGLEKAKLFRATVVKRPNNQ